MSGQDGFGREEEDLLEDSPAGHRYVLGGFCTRGSSDEFSQLFRNLSVRGHSGAPAGPLDCGPAVVTLGTLAGGTR